MSGILIRKRLKCFNKKTRRRLKQKGIKLKPHIEDIDYFITYMKKDKKFKTRDYINEY